MANIAVFTRRLGASRSHIDLTLRPMGQPTEEKGADRVVTIPRVQEGRVESVRGGVGCLVVVYWQLICYVRDTIGQRNKGRKKLGAAVMVQGKKNKRKKRKTL